MAIAARVVPETEDTHDEEIGGPPLPLGRRLVLDGRGRTFFREVEGPAGAPTVVLLHGWFASGGLNWFNAFAPLSEHYRVIAPDLRGHGRGIKSRRRFRIADCADDVAALCDALGTGPVIAVGYSLGGPVAQLLWRQHPHMVDGLVLCATADRFVPGVRERLIFSTVMAAAAGTSRAGAAASRLPLKALTRRLPSARQIDHPERPVDFRRWAAAEMGRHHMRQLVEVGQAVGTYNARKWIGRVDVPTAVMVTTKDRAIPPSVQLQMALQIPGATIHRVEDGHVACARTDYVPVMLDAIADVRARHLS
ncbi:MAG TPA: alpha/beta hydrolase [Acidimicrobiales bacterium]|nr:alpha/beta hydrolase [Acidimicrobiales bacterium]